MNKLVSVIIRTKNEESWIDSCLKKVFCQKGVKLEVIIVDNQSKDNTLKIASKYPVKVVRIKKFKPGKAINLGIKKSKGSIIACLSSHCIPYDDYWLKNLTYDLKNKKIAGVYGRQLPLPYSSDFDKRDLLITFGLDKKKQIKDSFFHNANSAFKRDIWTKYPFDENITNIEDRIWGQEVINAGFNLIYEPKASVYHWHGIHQDMDKRRCAQIVKILENLGDDFKQKNFKKISDLKVDVIIPIRGKSKKISKNETRLEYMIRDIQKNKFINKIYVCSDNDETYKLAKKLKCNAPFKRLQAYSESHIDLLTASKHCLDKLESRGIYSDYLIIATELFFDREPYFFDKLIKKIFNFNLSIVFPVKEEKGLVFKLSKKENKIEKLIDAFEPAKFRKDILFTSRPGYGLIITPSLLRKASINSNKTGFVTIKE